MQHYIQRAIDNSAHKHFVVYLLVACLQIHPTAIAEPGTQPPQLVTNNWCPQHCMQHPIGPGYLIEIIQEALSSVGIKTTVKFEPWLRAIKLVKRGKYDGLMTPAKSEEPELLRHKTPLATQRFCFYQPIGHKNAFIDLASFRNHSIAFVNGNDLGSEFMSFIGASANNVKVHELTTGLGEFAPRAFRFLMQGRVDAIAITEDMGDFYLGEHKEVKRLLQKSYCTDSEDLHVGLSPVNKERSAELGNMIDKGLKKIKGNGIYQKIMERYHQIY